MRVRRSSLFAHQLTFCNCLSNINDYTSARWISAFIRSEWMQLTVCVPARCTRMRSDQMGVSKGPARFPALWVGGATDSRVSDEWTDGYWGSALGSWTPFRATATSGRSLKFLRRDEWRDRKTDTEMVSILSVNIWYEWRPDTLLANVLEYYRVL